MLPRIQHWLHVVRCVLPNLEACGLLQLVGLMQSSHDCMHICWGIYANQHTYMHKVNPNIFFYFLWFYPSITFLSVFAHRDYFSQIFIYFCCGFIHSTSLSFRRSTHIYFHLNARSRTCRAESNCTISIARAHLGALSGVEAKVGSKVYAGWDTHLDFSPQCSNNRWGGENQ